MLPFPPRAHRKDFFAVNPLGTIPAFRDGDTVMTESAAICAYLGARYSPGNLGVAPEEAEYGAYLNALHLGEATLTVPQTLVLRYGRFEPPERRLPQVVEDYARWFGSRLRAFGSLFGDRTYAAADRFTAADISLGYALMLAEMAGLDEQVPDFARAYLARLRASGPRPRLRGGARRGARAGRLAAPGAARRIGSAPARGGGGDRTPPRLPQVPRI